MRSGTVSKESRRASGLRRGTDINLRSGPQMREYEEIANRVAAEQLAPVLDWGCGLGQMTDLLRQRGVEVESFDFRPGEPLHAGSLERFPDISVYVSGDPVQLPYRDNHFAAILSCGVLEHVEQPEASLTELHRVLRPNGRLWIYKLPNRFSYLEMIARRLDLIYPGIYYHGKHPDDRVYDHRRVAKLLADHGFRMDDCRRTNMLPLTINARFAWRYSEQIWRVNRALGRIPLANLVATNLDVDATAIHGGS